MKNLFVFITALLVSNSFVFSQKHAIVDDNNSWATVMYYKDFPRNYFQTEYAYFDGDSIVEGHSYKKVFTCMDELHENIKYRGLMREQDEKTFFISVRYPESEYLLCDFSLEEGVSFEYCWGTSYSVTLYVKTVDSIEINGSIRKRIQITEKILDTEYEVDTWVEGIGSLSGILWPCYVVFMNGGIKELLCYFQNDALIYKHPDFSECYYEGDLSVLPVEKNGLIVYPNPTTGELIIDNGVAGDPESSSGRNDVWRIENIEIFDMIGIKVYSQNYNGIVDISSFSKGLYILKIHDTNGQISDFKIIKQ
jgi:hypothetical protein